MFEHEKKHLKLNEHLQNLQEKVVKKTCEFSST